MSIISRTIVRKITTPEIPYSTFNTGNADMLVVDNADNVWICQDYDNPTIGSGTCRLATRLDIDNTTHVATRDLSVDGTTGSWTSLPTSYWPNTPNFFLQPDPVDNTMWISGAGGSVDNYLANFDQTGALLSYISASPGYSWGGGNQGAHGFSVGNSSIYIKENRQRDNTSTFAILKTDSDTSSPQWLNNEGLDYSYIFGGQSPIIEQIVGIGSNLYIMRIIWDVSGWPWTTSEHIYELDKSTGTVSNTIPVDTLLGLVKPPPWTSTFTSMIPHNGHIYVWANYYDYTATPTTVEQRISKFTTSFTLVDSWVIDLPYGCGSNNAGFDIDSTDHLWFLWYDSSDNRVKVARKKVT